MIMKGLVTGLAAIAIVASGSLAGCATSSQAEQGAVIGGLLGGVVGSQVGEGRGNTAAIIIGTLAGAMIGYHIGESMDDTDRMQTATALNESRTGEVTTWVNPDNGNRYVVTPTRTFERAQGPCREFRLDATVGDDPNQEVYGTACLQPDGSWLVSQ
ncbi:MAG: glycine zipper 2TM domain-containing protein [Woeseiaceae bacterium]|nr:glycine zipper 2TM domain-containing protein [Gammaproteobacteria bacterium]NNK24155.1 glycine zipper 2TM domain-containing protein [Woeseiaceae bacterium]